MRNLIYGSCKNIITWGVCASVCLFLLNCNDESSEVAEIILVCEPFGILEECTDGPILGECRRSLKFCWEDYWGECRGEVLPVPEVCDGLDNDCDGEVDNGVLNACGECGELPEEICDEVDNDCDGEVDEGFAGAVELCNGADDDCDGAFDEGLTKRRACVPEGAQGDWIVFNDDANSFSTCSRGWQECHDGYWHAILGICDDFIGPIQEICDGLDNNCNGIVDDIESLGECGSSNVGACEYGRELCVESEILCIDSITPQNEVCDGVDNNCNEAVDEDLFRECETACESGVEHCLDGEWVGCTGRSPTDEICDGEDNNCNGEVDEGLECICNYGDTLPCMAFPCGWGLKVCLRDGTWSDCEGEIPQPEMCNNYDDNCNDLIDEELVLECYDGEPETLDVGICHAGESICFFGTWAPCMSQQLPEDERCDEIDNDCDGIIDNMERVFEKVDLIFAIDVSGSMSNYIEPLIEGVGNYVASLQNSDHVFGIVIFGHMRSDNLSEPGYGYLHTQVSDINTFISGLQSLRTDGGTEPSLDVIFDIANPENSLEIAWRNDATPIVVLITDENAQTNRNLEAEDVNAYTHVCQLPGCDNQTNPNWVDGDPLEVFAFLMPFNFSPWNQIIAAEGVRLFDINRMREERTLEVDLQLLFTEICIDP